MSNIPEQHRKALDKFFAIEPGGEWQPEPSQYTDSVRYSKRCGRFSYVAVFPKTGYPTITRLQSFGLYQLKNKKWKEIT